MAKAAELKTSAVTNWLVDWLFASSRSDLRVVSEGEKGKRETRTCIGISLVEGEEESGEASTKAGV